MKKVHLRQMVLTLLLFFNPWRIKKIKLTPQFFHILIFCECVWWFRRQKNYRNCCVIVIVPWVLIAFVHCLPRSPAVNLLISALIVKCVDYRAFNHHRIAILAIQALEISTAFGLSVDQPVVYW